ncbi:MAG: hypothetical protein DGJ47_000939 [Rickettsiaceae bacterium]
MSYCILFVVLGVSVVSFWLKTDSGQQFVQSKVSNLLNDNVGIKVKFKNFDVASPLGIKADEIILYDDVGQIASFSKVNINISMLMLFAKRLDFTDFIIENIQIFRLQRIAMLNSDKSSSKGIAINISKINFRNIEIKKLLLRKEAISSTEDVVVGLKAYVKYNLLTQGIKFRVDSIITSELFNDLGDLTVLVSGEHNVANNKLILNNHSIQTKAGHIKGNSAFDFKRDLIDGQLNYDLAGITKISNKIYALNKANGQIKLANKLSKPSITSVGNIIFVNNNIPLKHQLNISVQNEDIVGDFNLSQGALHSSGKINYRQNILKLYDVLVLDQNLRHKADLSYNLNTKLLNGELLIQDNALERFKPLFPFLNHGKVDILAKFSNNSGKQSISVKGNLKNLYTTYGNCENLDISFDSPDIFAKNIGYMNVKSQYLSSNYLKTLSLKKFDISAKSVNDIIEFDSSLLSRDFGSLDFTFKGKVNFNKSKYLIISELGGMIGDSLIHLSEGLKLSWYNGINLSVPKLVVDKGLIQLDYNQKNNNVTGNLIISNLVTKAGARIFANNFEQVIINGSSTLRGKVSSPELNNNFKIKNISSSSKSEDILFDLMTNTNKNKSIINLDISKENRFLGNINASFTNKLSLKPFAFEIYKDKPFNVSLKLDKQFNAFSLLPKVIGQKINGHLDGSMKLSGTLNSPVVKGSMSLTDGVYRYKKYGIKVQNISSDIIAQSNGNILFNNIKAQDNDGNGLNGKGNFNPQEKLYKFTLSTLNFHPISTLYLQGAMSGDVIYQGDFKGANLSGDLILGPMEIKIPEQFNESIPELNVVDHIDKDHDAEKKLYDNLYKINLALNIQTNDQVFVKGMGVNTQLSGKIKAQGNSIKPILKGKLRSVKGTFKEFGKVLNVEKSVLVFDGPIMPSPYLNINGVTNVDGVEIRVNLSGSIANPVLTIDSSPNLSQEKALSLLLFGIESDNISPFQAVQLTNSVRRLSGNGSDFNPIGIGKQILRVDDISFKQDADNDDSSSVSFGKYLHDKIYVEVEKGVQDNSTRTKVELQLTPKIFIENINDYDNDNSIGINWKHDY